MLLSIQIVTGKWRQTPFSEHRSCIAREGEGKKRKIEGKIEIYMIPITLKDISRGFMRQPATCHSQLEMSLRTKNEKHNIPDCIIRGQTDRRTIQPLSQFFLSVITSFSFP